MSGGSYEYICYKIEDVANTLDNVEKDPRRASFQKLLRLVAKAMHDIEWVDSCDYSSGDEHEAIDAVFSFLQESPELLIKAYAYDVLKERLQAFFKEVEKK